jgi:hypothetical protein
LLVFPLLVAIVWSAVAAFFVLLCRAAALGDSTEASAWTARDEPRYEAHPLELLLEDRRAPVGLGAAQRTRPLARR